MRPLRTPVALAAAITSVALTATALAPASAAQHPGARDRASAPTAARATTASRVPTKAPTRIGYGGAVTSVDPYASRVGLQVLRRGGNATDAAVAAAATLGVTEPYSAGIGGGGYFVHYSARTGQVRTIDGRETAPRSMPRNAFIDPKTGDPYNFTPELVTSGVSVGVPGTLATWQRALKRWGSTSLGKALAPAARLARRGFVVDRTFRQQTIDNELRFKAFRSTRKLYWRGGHAPTVGSRLRNPDLADTYALIARRGTGAFYRGPLAGEIVRAVRKPPKTRSTKLPVPPGFMTRRDLARYAAINRKPTHVGYRGYGVFGMAPSSSGGTTVGEALNILERFKLRSMSTPDALHHYLEASALAFADRGAYVGDPAYVRVPVRDLLSQRFAAERACRIDPNHVLPKPTPAGNVRNYDGRCSGSAATTARETDTENISTTNLTVADKWGNVVEYTLTIEQTGGSGIVVPGRGFLLNNELTDFSPEFKASDPNRIQPGKRPRSSMSPTIVLRHGRPFLALGSPGGSTIITTVLQMLFNRIDRGMTIQQAIAAPRASERNFSDTTTAEPAFVRRYRALLAPYGHKLKSDGDTLTSDPFIGAATAIEFGPRGLLTAVDEPTRRGGGSAKVVRPRP
jgi:gamma-glutamyltranspeptidase / glutathione hydrolase